jgi:hypothetical protein
MFSTDAAHCNHFIAFAVAGNYILRRLSDEDKWRQGTGASAAANNEKKKVGVA